MAIKNFWSLQVGEVIVADLIRKHLGKDYEIFIPLNNQLKDIDLVVINLKTKKIATVQVKESREYAVGEGDGWFRIDEHKIKNKVADFYIFMIYSIQENETKLKMATKTLIIPSEVLLEKSKQKTARKGVYTYYFEIKGGKAQEDREDTKNPVDYSEYINNYDLLKV